MRRGAAGAAAVALAVVAVLMVASAAAADPVPAELVEVGWWTSRPGATEAEGDGFEVAAGIDGTEQSVAALRFHVEAGEVTDFDLVLHEERAVGTEFGGMIACRTAPGWPAEDPGALDQAPEPDCGTQVRLTRSTSGTWLGTLGALVPEGGDVSVMILPEYESPVGVGSPFIVTVGEVEITRAEGTPPTTTTTTTTTFDAPGDVGTGGSEGFASPSSPSAFDTPGSVTASPPAEEPATTPTTEPAAGEEEFFTLGPIEDEQGDSKPWARLALVVPLSVGAGAAAVFVRRSLQARGVRIA